MVMRADGYPLVIVPMAGYFAKLHRRLHDRMPHWVIYRPITREYPGYWVARMHIAAPELKATRFVLAHDTLEELRTILPPGLLRFERSESDVPEIEETWI